MTRFIAFDVETGGISPDRHALTQIAAVACTDEGGGGRATIVEQIALPVRPPRGMELEDEALAVYGHTRASLAARPLAIHEREAARLFLRWLESLGDDWHGAPLVAHQAVVRWRFVEELLRRTGGGLRERPLICTMGRQMTLQHRGQAPTGSTKLRDCVGMIGLVQAEPYEALVNATLTAHLYVWQEQHVAWLQVTGDAETDIASPRRYMGYIGMARYRSPDWVFNLSPELAGLVRDAQAGALPDLPGIQAPGTRQRVGEMNAFVVGSLGLIRRHVEDLSYLERAVREHRKGEAN